MSSVEFKAQLEKRVSDLEQVMNQSMANHNSIIGAYNEAKYMLEQFIAYEKANEDKCMHCESEDIGECTEVQSLGKIIE